MTFCSYAVFPNRTEFVNFFSLRHDRDNELLSNAIQVFYVELSKLKELLKKPETEWHLEKEGEHLFRLYPIAITKPLVCDLLEMQPGQPGGSDWTLRNPMEKQNFAFRMKVNGYGYIQDPRFYCKYGMLQFRAVVKGGQYLLFDGKEAYVTDRNYNRLAQVDYSGSCQIDQGDTQLSFGCSFGGDEGPEVQVRIITKAKPYLIRR